jgi:hypothetical protein
LVPEQIRDPVEVIQMRRIRTELADIGAEFDGNVELDPIL